MIVGDNHHFSMDAIKLMSKVFFIQVISGRSINLVSFSALNRKNNSNLVKI